MIRLFSSIVIGSVMAVAAASHAKADAAFANPDFVPSSVPSSPYYYTYNGSTDGWISSSGNSGYAAQDTGAFWDNGSAGSVSGVAFLQGYNSYIYQTVSGFIVGDTYQITALVNSRTIDQPANLTSTVSDGVTNTVLNNESVPSVALSGNFATPFSVYDSTTFVADASTLTIAFVDYSQNGDLLLSDAGITNLTTASAVPEPTTMALLGSGIFGVAMLRRRRNPSVGCA